MSDTDPSAEIDGRIAELGDWRGDLLARIRRVIHAADPDVEEGWKWRGVPTWEHDGLICTGESYRDKVKVTFHQGAALDDHTGLFNSSLEGNQRRAVDWFEGDELDEDAIADLFRQAVARNEAKKATKKR